MPALEIEPAHEGGIGITLPSGVSFEDPISPEIFIWLAAFTKGVRGMRVYAENNKMLVKFVDDAHNGLSSLLSKVPE